jgi:murein DD-endopeptidase MepM/ murein hydrolase activator NlpD
MSASCSNSLRLQEPFFTASTENQREIIGGDGSGSGESLAYQQPMPPPVQSNAVSRSDLPPPPSQQYASIDPSPSYDPPVQQVSTGAFEWTAVGGRVITVSPSENLDTLTAKFGVPAEQILAANQLTSPSQVRPGKLLVIPRRVPISPDRLRNNEPVVADAQPMPSAVPAEVAPVVKAPRQIASDAATYTVQPGETLFGVARKVGMTPVELANLNSIGTDTQLQVGQTLRIKGAVDKGTAIATNAAKDAKPTQLGAAPKPLGQLVVNGSGQPVDQPVAPPKIRLTSPAETAETGQLVANAPKIPAVPADAAPAATDAKVTAQIDDAADAASADGKSFRWPVRGRIISGFGSKPNGEKNDGINLAVPEGTSVKAIETGTVIYAGNELAGYGNLILIRHADGWVSAYAHNKDMLVKRGDTIRRGQTIAHAGMTGSVTSPQVHFELRKGAKPVNPLDYLAGA